jgi:hypothetical protein
VSAYTACQQTTLVVNKQVEKNLLPILPAEPQNEAHFSFHAPASTNVTPDGIINPDKLEIFSESTFENVDLTRFIFYEIPKFRVMASIQYKKGILEDNGKPLAAIEELYNLKQWNCGDHKSSLFAKAVGQRVVLNCLKSTTNVSHALTKENSFASGKVIHETPIQEISSKEIRPKEIETEVNILKSVSLNGQQSKKQSFQNIIHSAADMMKNVTLATSLPLNEVRKNKRHAHITKQAPLEKKESCNQIREHVEAGVIQPLSNSLQKGKRQRKFSSLLDSVLPTCTINASHLKIPSLPRTHRFFESSGAKSEKHIGPNSSKKRRKFGFK